MKLMGNLCCKRRKMADEPDDVPETLVQKAVKLGLITIPLVVYVSWAYKKFVPCPRMKYRHRQIKPTWMAKRKSVKKQGKHDSSPARQDNKRKRHANKITRKEYDQETYGEQSQDCQKHTQHKSWAGDAKEATTPEKNECMEYIMRSTRETRNVGRTDGTQPKLKPAAGQRKTPKGDTHSQTDPRLETIHPEAFDKLFEQHFQWCLNDFKEHKRQFEKELDSAAENCQEVQSFEHEGDKKANYLECLANLNLDKDFECDPNFGSKDLNAPYIVKDYKCKAKVGNAGSGESSDLKGTRESGYLKCLTDMNLDRHFDGPCFPMEDTGGSPTRKTKNYITNKQAERLTVKDEGDLCKTEERVPGGEEPHNSKKRKMKSTQVQDAKRDLTQKTE